MLKHLAVLLLAIPAAALADAPAQNPPAKGPGCLAHYPQAAKDAGAEGTTRLDFTVTEQGKVTDIGVARSSGNADLDAASVTCARLWTYKPATKEGKPTAVRWSATVQWKLH